MSQPTPKDIANIRASRARTAERLSLHPAGSAPVFALSYDDLQEIHTLTGMVCGWRMSLPTKMICQAQEVSKRMIALNRIDLTQRKRLKEAKAFIARFNTMFAKAQNDRTERPAHSGAQQPETL